jgi:hypothetical protein
MYEPAEPGDYQPPTATPSVGRYTVTAARNPALNGEVTFKYPTSFDEVAIGARMTELVRQGRISNLHVDDLPLRARLFVAAIATLEHVIKTAPKGWYITSESGRPILAPGALGEGDEELVLDVHQAFVQWKKTFREPVRERESGEAEAVVPSGQADGEPEG